MRRGQLIHAIPLAFVSEIWFRNGSEKTIFAAIARIGFPTPSPTPPKRVRSLKSVAWSVLFTLRAKLVKRSVILGAESDCHFLDMLAIFGESSVHRKRLLPLLCKKCDDAERHTRSRLDILHFFCFVFSKLCSILTFHEYCIYFIVRHHHHLYVWVLGTSLL
jgi:hypothetical protein